MRMNVDLIVSISNLFSLAFIILSFLISLISLKLYRYLSSLQVQMTIFVFIALVGEFINLVGSMDLIELGISESIAMFIHSLSMAVLMIFIIYRWRTYFRGVVTISKDFEDLIYKAVDNALEKLFDRNILKTFKFYIDTKIVIKNPRKFSNILNKIFGDFSNVIIKSICEEIRATFGLEEDIRDIEECIKKAGQKFHEPNA